ncbi:MAG TPA: class I SAM-dependent methyltransferase [Sphingopyxis sp.]|nr:class I SAM-dependent methyltransferase [Sphingopyxis sp.]
MSFAASLASQLAHPDGMAGRLLGHAMDFVNRRPTRLAIDALAPRAGEHILDVGCGTGAALDALLRRADVRATGIDPSRVMAAMAAERLDGRALVLRTRIETMPFGAEMFDGVMLLNILYFCDTRARQLARVRETLRPGGRAVAYVTHRDSMTRWAFTREGHHRLYDERELRELFVAAGFASAGTSVQAVPVTRSIKGLVAIATR